MNTILTDDDRKKVFESLPDALEGFMKKWGWLHFAKGIEAAVLAKLAQQELEGWKLVPVEPGEWVFADKVLGHDSHPNHKERMRRLYRAMLAAAPEAPAQASAVDERAAFEAWLGIKPCGASHDFGWAAWQARAALAQKVQA